MESSITTQCYEERKRQISDLRKQYELCRIDNGDSILHLVIKNEKPTTKETIEILRTLLEEGDDPDVENSNGETVLHLAIKRRENDIIDFLLSRNIKFKDSVPVYFIRDEGKRIANMKCKSKISDEEMQKVESESANFVEWLISKGLDIDRPNEVNENALVVAINSDLFHILPVLLRHTKNIDFVDYHNKTLLHLFVFRANSYSKRYAADIVKILLDRGVSVDAEDNCKETPIEIAIKRKKDLGIIEMMIERSTCREEALLNLVIKEWIDDTERDYYVKIARVLIRKGADINKPDDDGLTPLCHAVENQNLSSVEFLRENGVDFSFTTKNGETLMHLLVKSSGYDETAKRIEIEMFDILVSNGCSVNAKDDNGVTPLHLAADDGHDAFVQKLLELGADINCRDHRMETPLMYLATHSYQTRMAELLLKYGANVDAKDIQGLTALHATAAKDSRYYGSNRIEMLRILLKHGADFNARTNAGHSVLRMALWRHYNKNKLNPVAPGDLPSLTSYMNDCRYVSKEVQVLLEHWIKLDIAKLECNIDDEYRDLNKTEKYKSYYEKCSNEIKTLKSTFIDSHISLYTLLHMNPNSKHVYVNSKKLKSLLESPELEKQFPEYAVLILASYHEAVARKPLLKPAREAWLKLTKINLPEECIEHILAFVRNSDLFNMIENE